MCVCVCASCAVLCAGCGTATAVWGLFLFLLLLLLSFGGVSASLIRLSGYDISEMAPSNSNGTSFVSAVCPPQSISDVNNRWLVDTDSFNFISMCLLIKLTMYEGSRMRVSAESSWSVYVCPVNLAALPQSTEDCKSVPLPSVFDQVSHALDIRNRRRIVDRHREETHITARSAQSSSRESFRIQFH